MLHRTKAVVLKKTKYGDNNLIVHLYTLDFGRQSYLIYGINSKKGRSLSGFFEHLSLLEIEVHHKTNREIQQIKNIKPEFILHQISSDVIKRTIAIFIAEVLSKTLRESESNPELFKYLNHSVQLLDLCDVGVMNFHLVFLLQFTRFLGIYPQNNQELIQYELKGLKLSLAGLLSYKINNLGSLRIDREERIKALHAIIRYYNDHLENLGDIKSIEILNDVFNG